MTFEELNIVRKLKNQIADENRKLRALKIVIGAFPHKYGKSANNVSSAGVAKSDFENFSIQIADTEKKIENLQVKLDEEILKLTEKIRKNFPDGDAQKLLIYRYVFCKYFHDISFLMGYSETWAYWKHNQILKSLESIKAD